MERMPGSDQNNHAEQEYGVNGTSSDEGAVGADRTLERRRLPAVIVARLDG
jgi:hypothetical protein